MSFVDFVVLPPGHGRSVTDFWGWDAREAQLCCPDDVSGDRGGCSARRGLKPKFNLSTQTMVTAGIFPFKENSHGRAWNRTRDFMISSQRLWPLDHEAGHKLDIISYFFFLLNPGSKSVRVPLYTGVVSGSYSCLLFGKFRSGSRGTQPQSRMLPISFQPLFCPGLQGIMWQRRAAHTAQDRHVFARNQDVTEG